MGRVTGAARPVPVTGSARGRGGRASAVASVFVLAGLVCQEVGASIAVLLFPDAGPAGMVALRLAFSAVILLIVARPRLTGHGRADWAAVAAFGLVIAGMNVSFYFSLERLHLGTAVTIEVLGPLVLGVVTGRRASAWIWAVLAVVGVVLLGYGGYGDLDPLGVLLALAAGASWVGYILLSAETGSRFPRLDGLALAMTVGAVATLPIGLALTGTVLLRPDLLLLGLAVGALSSAIPYALELMALRRMPSSTFAVLMSLAPAAAAITGFLVLGQRMTLLQAVAVGLVVIASAGAVRASAIRRPAAPVPG
jgi:inner membrane transporter RhtA